MRRLSSPAEQEAGAAKVREDGASQKTSSLTCIGSFFPLAAGVTTLVQQVGLVLVQTPPAARP